MLQESDGRDGGMVAYFVGRRVEISVGFGLEDPNGGGSCAQTSPTVAGLLGAWKPPRNRQAVDVMRCRGQTPSGIRREPATALHPPCTAVRLPCITIPCPLSANRNTRLSTITIHLPVASG